MDIGDLGFLIIAFIVFIVNFIVKAKKEKTQAQTENQKTVKPELPEPWELEETLPPLFDNPFNREKKIEAINRKTTRIPVLSSQESYEHAKLRMQASHEGMSSLSESLYKEDEMENLIYKQDGSTDISYTSDLLSGNITEEMKKVIIYSEILHRKYE